MISNWNNFEHINENIQKARRVLRDANLTETNPDFIKLRTLLSSRRGYLGKFTEWMFKDKVKYDQLENLFNRIKGITLPKQIDQYKTPEEIIDSLIRDDSETALNQMLHAIPSRTRQHLMEEGDAKCDDCDGEKTSECDECYGSGDIECDECYGSGDIDCDECDGTGDIWDSKIDETKECPKCKGKSTLPCPKKCDDGRFPCPKKCDNGYQPCSSCKGTGEGGSIHSAWNKLKNFLILNRDKKDIIIDFLSKKSGRYGDEYDPCETLIHDLQKILKTPSVEDVKKLSLKSPNIKFMYEDDKYLIVAVNYDGIKEIGSSYWCIVEDEDTFNDYVIDNDAIQLILYDKSKKPLMDEKSVMGITMKPDKSVEAAHWEDDADCSTEADTLINGGINYDYNNITRTNRGRDPFRQGGKAVAKQIKVEPLKIPIKNILNALSSLYDYDSAVITRMEFSIPEIYKEKIDKCLSYKKSADKLKAVNNLFSDFRDYCNDEYVEKYEMFDMEFLREFRKKVRESGVKIDLSLEDAVELRLFDICKFNNTWLNEDIFDIIDNGDFGVTGRHSDSGNRDYIAGIMKNIIQNGYDIGKYLRNHEEYYQFLMSYDMLDITRYYKMIDWNNIMLADRNVKWLIENDFNFVSNNDNILPKAIRYINGKGLIPTYKNEILDLLNRNRINRETCEYISEEVEDDDISIAAAKSLIPKGLFKKFKFQINKLRHLKGMDEI